MLKRTLFFSNPYRLLLKNQQLVIESAEFDTPKTVPVEDIGFVIFDHPQISFTMKLVEQLNAFNVGVVFCDSNHLPSSMLLSLDSNHIQTEIFNLQVTASEPLKKALWKQTIEAKINNQAAMLVKQGRSAQDLKNLARTVKSGDVENREGFAARLYWQRMFGNEFYRDRFGPPPNHFLNYGYSILRSAVARSLAGSGLLATLGIHHHNRYNSYCLADDIMEPYRPYVDEMVVELFQNYPDSFSVEKEHKAELLKLLAIDVEIGDVKRPLMVALSITTASLARCFSGENRKIVYPEFS